ncbi:MAG: IS982 family transposase [Candidatus Diapherotrites archaeon]
MNGLTNYITKNLWEDIITTWYVLVDDAYWRIIRKCKSPRRASGPAPKFTDSEVITVALIIETFFHGNEELGYAFVFQYLWDMFPGLLDLDRFNARRRELVGVIEAIRCDLRDQKLNGSDPVRLVDSAPVTVVTYTRGSRCTSVVGNEYFGVVTSKKSKVFGFRLHLTASVDQLIDEWVLAPSSIPDPKVLDELVLDCRNLVLIGDKIYNDAELEERLWRKRGILLLPLRKDNQKQRWPEGVQKALGHFRHRVETVFSVLTTVFNVERPRGRSLAGYVVRVATCILAHTLSFFLA